MSKTTLRESNSILTSPREEDADDDQQTTTKTTTTAPLKMTLKNTATTTTTNTATISAAEKVFITFKMCFPFDLSFPPLRDFEISPQGMSHPL